MVVARWTLDCCLETLPLSGSLQIHDFLVCLCHTLHCILLHYCNNLLSLASHFLPNSLKQNSTTQKACFGLAFRRIVIILMLFISGNIHPNPGPVSAIHAVPKLAFNDFCDRTCMGFLHINIRKSDTPHTEYSPYVTLGRRSAPRYYVEYF